MLKKRILIIDDEASVTRGVKMNLETTGNYVVRTVNDAPQALAAARDFQPDLVLLDVMMPEMDGGDIAAQLKADPKLKDVPIVFLTAIVSNTETEGREMLSGTQHYLAKPVDLSELIKCMEKHLQK